MRTLYLCYFGLREPLVQTQVLPYLRQISGGGVDVSLLTFEPNKRRAWPQEDVEGWRSRLEKEGIHWFALPYHKRPSLLVTAYDILAGARFASDLVRQHHIEVVHARAHVAMAMGLLVQRWTGCRLVFDIRGLMAEEYADAGIWKENSLIFRAVKRLELAGIQKADQIVVLTRRLRDWLIENNLASPEKIEVIPCCVDFSRFDPELTKDLEPVSNRFEVIYAGSASGLYLVEDMAQFFLMIRAHKPDAFLRILTHSSAETTSAVLRRIGIDRNDFWVGAVGSDEIPLYLRRAHLGLSFRKPAFSQIAASPTKIPEYLASGLPVVCNAGAGDMDELLEEERVGIVVPTLNSEAYAKAAERALLLASDPLLTARCFQVASRYFDLETVGGMKYRGLYQRLFEMKEPHPITI